MMKFSRYLRVSITLVLIGNVMCLKLIAQDDLSNYRWTTIDAIGEPTARHENSFVRHNGKFYLIGGRGINPVDVFDPKTSTWELKQKTPFEMHHFQAVSYGNAIYILGGMTGSYPGELPIENIWIYYPESDIWEQGSLIPEGRRRGAAGAALYKDKIYMICGIDFGHTSGTNNYFDSYDLKTGKWEVLTKAPHIRDHVPAIVVEDKLYCIGGRNSSFHYPDNFMAFFGATVPYVDVYDFKTEKWHTLKEKLPIPTAGGGLTYLNNKILYMGGEGEFLQGYNHTQCLDPVTGMWTQLSPLNTGRHASGAIVYHDEIFIAAGSPNKGGGNLSSIEVFSGKHGWSKLFNGENLDNWTIQSVKNDKGKQYWRVDNGSILCDTRGRDDHKYIWLQSNEEFGDFELRLKYQTFQGEESNSGVQFRSRYDQNATVDGEGHFAGWLDGPQVDINSAQPWRTGFIYDETRDNRRWVNPDLPDWNISQEKYAPKKVIHYYNDEGPEWNDMTLICKGQHIQTFVNNLLVSDYDGKGVLDDDLHRKFNVHSSGHIALQLHTNSKNYLRFKDIEIRRLD